MKNFLVLCLATAVSAVAAAAVYVDADGSQAEAAAASVSAFDTAWGTADAETWYVVDGTLALSQGVTVSGDVRLILADGCSLTVNGGINVAAGQSFTVYGQTLGTGTLTAQGGYAVAGIGGNDGGTVGAITIVGGTIKAIGGAWGAGIGGGSGGSGGTVVISGGKVTAAGGAWGAGIGGGLYGSGGTITISGGTVMATGGAWGAGIGGGSNGSGDAITISGGTVMAKGNAGGAGIGGGDGGASGSFTMAESEGAVIVASSIADKSGKNNWRGLIVDGADGTFYGLTSATLTADVMLLADCALTIATGQTLTVAEGVTLTNAGTIAVSQGGALDVQGTLANSGTVSNAGGTFTNNGLIKDHAGTTPAPTGGSGSVRTGYDTVSYVDADGTEATVYVLSVTSADTAWTDDWYVVPANTSLAVDARVTVSGDVKLILSDGSSLTVKGGIDVADGERLAVYGQPLGTGALTAYGEHGKAGIGGGGVIAISGGTVAAEGGDYGAGIGGGNGGNAGTVIIVGGRVEARGGSDAAGIGGGHSGDGGTITVSGGTVAAVSGAWGAGIGGGRAGSGGTITVSGGMVEATSDSYGAGIGGGFHGAGGTIAVFGGTVMATGGSSGAGIGGGYCNDGGTVSISGGTVMAVGKDGGAGIGGGEGGEIGSFFTEERGTAFIVASSIDDQSKKDAWSGVIVEGPSGQVYGSAVSLTTDAVLPEGVTLTIAEGKTLTVADGVSLTNDGVIVVGQGGTLRVQGTLINSGSVSNGGGTIANDGLIKDHADTMPAPTEGDGTVRTGYKTVSYVDADGSEVTVRALPMTSVDTAWTDDWYVVSADTALTFGTRVAVSGEVNLILEDGCALTADGGIQVSEGNAFAVYGQTGGTGTLTATGVESGAAGIGGDRNAGVGSIAIHGGVVTATGDGRAAGIGGGMDGSVGTIAITGGTVIATGGERGAGIGCGEMGKGADIAITGGTVIATGGPYGAGIGSEMSHGGTIAITGGTVTATGGQFGIVGSQEGTVTITGGTVTATADEGGAGIRVDWNGIFSTGSDGHAFIVASSVSLETSDESLWRGVIFDGTLGKVYGSAVTLTTDATIPAGTTLTIAANQTLSVAEGVTLTNEGTIIVETDGTFENNGTVTNGEGAAIMNNGTVTDNTGTMAPPSGNGAFEVFIPVSYVNESGEETQTLARPMTSADTVWTSGWYVANDPNGIAIAERVMVTGEVGLILADGCTLTVGQGICVEEPNTLNIHQQAGGTGALNGTYAGTGAVIGSDGGGVVGTIGIYGGNFVLSSDAGGASIGNGGWNSSGGNVILAGGTIQQATGSGLETAIMADNLTVSGGVFRLADMSLDNVKKYNCIVFKGTEGTVYGNTMVRQPFTLAEDETLTIAGGNGLTLAAGVPLANDGTIFFDGTPQLTVAPVGIVEGESATAATSFSLGYINGQVPAFDSVVATFSCNEVDYPLEPRLADGHGMAEQRITHLPMGLYPVTVSLAAEQIVDFYGSGTAILCGNAAASLSVGAVVGYVAADGTPLKAAAIPMTVTGAALGVLGETTWYAVDADVTVSERIVVSGDVRLILADGCTLTASAGITVADDDWDVANGSLNALTIYAQQRGTGTLLATAASERAAGIGGTEMSESAGSITVNGGTVTAVGMGEAPGIGGGGFHGSAGTIVVNGGTVTATGGPYAPGIGSGVMGFSDGCRLTVTGGTVCATGGQNGSGISLGRDGLNSSITVTGGTVTATGGENGSGIESGYSGTLTICGGTVTAVGRNEGAGISGYGAEGVITVCGGTVYAAGGDAGVGIGAAYDSCTFSTTDAAGNPGNAFIVASSISDSDDTSAWNGVIFLGAGGAVYGTSVTLTTDATIPAGTTLTIAANQTLFVAEGVTLTNEGTIIVETDGTFENNGTVKNYSGNAPEPNAGDGEFRTGYEYVKYLDAEGAEQTVRALPVTASDTAWSDDWYLVNGNVEVPDCITVTGDVNLLLANGYTLRAAQGISVNQEGARLTVYAQSADESAMGTLVATGNSRNGHAGIGGNSESFYGSITINGGRIQATGGNNSGIGGISQCYEGPASRGSITINGGIVQAEGHYWAPGIGIGGNNGSSVLIAINGGSVTATGGSDGGAGIGTRENCTKGNFEIVITGGTVRAIAKNGGAGIGAGANGINQGRIAISGGTVYAQGGASDSFAGAGIGDGGGCQEAGEISTVISGGIVTAVGGGNAAGIGAGSAGGISGPAGIFSTGVNGCAVITASSISDNDDTSGWSGVIFQGANGAVYGAPTLTTDITIPEGHTLTIADGRKLTVGAGVTLTNNGTIVIAGRGMLTVAAGGSLINNNVILNAGTVEGSASDGDAGMTGMTLPEGVTDETEAWLLKALAEVSSENIAGVDRLVFAEGTTAKTLDDARLLGVSPSVEGNGDGTATVSAAGILAVTGFTLNDTGVTFTVTVTATGGSLPKEGYAPIGTLKIYGYTHLDGGEKLILSAPVVPWISDGVSASAVLDVGAAGTEIFFKAVVE